MADIEIKDVTKIFPFVSTKGFFNRKKKEQFLLNQKNMPYITNEGVIVLQHINLKISQDEFVVILGESGSGKSTLLRIIAGLEKETLGSILFNNQDMNGLPPEKRNVAMVFQNYSLYPHLNVRDNIAYPLRMEHQTRDEIKEKVEKIAEITGIQNILESIPSQLSGGQAQRVAIARALVRNPEVFLLDEPLSNLDTSLRSSLRKELKKIHSNLHIPFIYVTHDQNDALYMADRVIVLKNGIIHQDSTLEDLYNYPADTYCAQFLGSPKMNLYPDIKVKNHEFTLFGKTYKNSPIRNGTVTVGIRPIDVLRSADGFKAVVDYSEQIESNVVIHVLCNEKELTLVEKATPTLSNIFVSGTELHLSLNEESMHFFNEEGKRIN